MSAHLDSEDLITLKRFLSDELPPLLFADEADRVLQVHPSAVAGCIASWVADQFRGGGPLPVSDYLFHAAKKLHLLAELELIDSDRLTAYLRALTPMLLSVCPEVDRDRLARDLATLELSHTDLASPVEVVHRPGSSVRNAAERASSSPPAAVAPEHHVGPQPRADAEAVPDLASRSVGLRRLNLLLDRLESIDDSMTPAGRPGSSATILAEIIGEVAQSAKSSREIEGQVKMLQGLGIRHLDEGLVRTLTRSLPDWAPPEVATAAGPTSSAARAIERVVTLSADREEQSKRFGELVMTAVEQVNEGSLGRAATLIDLAERMIAEQKVDQFTASSVRGQAEAVLTEERLLELAEQEDQRHLLRRVMRFFPGYTTEELLIGLESESTRERRRRVIRLLTVHGAEARCAAVAKLAESLKGHDPAPWFLERNFVYLMRTLPRPLETPIDGEIDLLVQTSDLAAPLPLVRESIAALGQIRHDRAERTLMARVNELERALLGEAPLPHTPDELLGLVDSITTALGRSPSRAARRAVVNHAVKRQSALGDTASRLAALAGQDLSNDPELVRGMVAQLQAELPVKVFGLAVKGLRRPRLAEALVDALSATDTPEVRRVLEEVAKGFPGHTLGQSAGRVLRELQRHASEPPAPARDTTTLSGDLAAFGLPNLLQNLADARLSGRLTITDGAGAELAAIGLSGGMVRDAQSGRLAGVTAVYDLLARPGEGRFSFVSDQALTDPDEPTATLHSTQHLLLEGMRRYDELVRATAVVPDEARYMPSDTPPTKPDPSMSGESVARVWARASAGASPAECERSLGLDAYQIRACFAHWVDTGALVAHDG